MRTVLDLLDPPCPPEALSEASFQGIDLDAPELGALKRLFYEDAPEEEEARKWNSRAREPSKSPEKIEEMIEKWKASSKSFEASLREQTKADKNKEKVGEALSDACRDEVPHIFSTRVSCRNIAAWIRAANHWHVLLRRDLVRALELDRWIALDTYHNDEYVDYCPDGERSARILQCSDGLLAASYERDGTSGFSTPPWYRRDGKIWYPRRSRLTARRLKEGEICNSYAAEVDFKYETRGIPFYVKGTKLEPLVSGYVSALQHQYLGLFARSEEPSKDREEGARIDALVDGLNGLLADVTDEAAPSEDATTGTDEDQVPQLIDRQGYLAALRRERLSEQYMFAESEDLVMQHSSFSTHGHFVHAPKEVEINAELRRLYREIAGPGSDASASEPPERSVADAILRERRRNREAVTRLP